ncbi:Cytidylyltransferase [Penicillium argentinense]|uniref:Cytidylyltransferase n=1 Tax=Penicillium argentinense TaxID=1131581 RepID=A0A9W9G5C3_9EURO|nr:Cytidylyltransferase [Penicillium argentinense]KAJ5112294.1 Cytidylyltransferase [Penicillium argentinense]
MAPFQTLRTQYTSLLKRFNASSRDFEVLASIPERSPPAKTLFVLDSSFNPPTRAHLRIASSALRDHLNPSSRLLLLLATQNADKPTKPASFEDRLAMMELFAHDLRTHLATNSASESSHLNRDLPTIDICVTKKPFFIDKATAIEESGCYSTPLEQVHLTGYDTLIRIFDTKYYPPEHTLKPLNSLFSKHRLRVTMRPSDDWGSMEDQQEFLRALARGDRESEEGPREWAQKIQLVEGRKANEPSISSTRAREAIQSAIEDLEWLVSENVRQYLLSEKPYSAHSPGTRI